jgi:hypothetical protein
MNEHFSDKEAVMTREEQQILRLKEKLLNLGPLLPGSISEQWNVCGTPGCKCKDSKHPRRHGPYYQLSFTVANKSSTLFVRIKDLAEARRRIRRYQQFKDLTKQLIQAHIELARKTGFKRS